MNKNIRIIGNVFRVADIPKLISTTVYIDDTDDTYKIKVL